MARCCDPNRANREANPPTEVRERDRNREPHAAGGTIAEEANVVDRLLGRASGHERDRTIGERHVIRITGRWCGRKHGCGESLATCGTRVGRTGRRQARGRNALIRATSRRTRQRSKSRSCSKPRRFRQLRLGARWAILRNSPRCSRGAFPWRREIGTQK